MFSLTRVQTPEDGVIFKDFIDKNHSYINHTRVPGRRINYLVKYNNDLVGAIGISGATLALKSRDILLKFKNKEHRFNKINNFGNNYRFCLNTNIPNAGSQVLSLFRKTAAIDWKEKYGNELLGIETFVEPSKKRNGSVYKADNWILIGKTKGFQIKRLPIKLMSSHNIEEKIKEFKLKYNTDRPYFCKKVKKKLIFFKSLVKNLEEKVNENI